jgi:hypothetical protein
MEGVQTTSYEIKNIHTQAETTCFSELEPLYRFRERYPIWQAPMAHSDVKKNKKIIDL